MIIRPYHWIKRYPAFRWSQVYCLECNVVRTVLCKTWSWIPPQRSWENNIARKCSNKAVFTKSRIFIENTEVALSYQQKLRAKYRDVQLTCALQRSDCHELASVFSILFHPSRSSFLFPFFTSCLDTFRDAVIIILKGADINDSQVQTKITVSKNNYVV